MTGSCPSLPLRETSSSLPYLPSTWTISLHYFVNTLLLSILPTPAGLTGLHCCSRFCRCSSLLVCSGFCCAALEVPIARPSISTAALPGCSVVTSPQGPLPR